MDVDDQRSEMEAPPPDPGPSQSTVPPISAANNHASSNVPTASSAQTSSMAAQQITRIPVVQLQVAPQPLQQQQPRLVLRTQQQTVHGGQNQPTRSVRHVRPSGQVMVQGIQQPRQLQRVPPIAANHVVGTHPLPFPVVEQLQPNLLQIERRQEYHNRQNFQLSRGPGDDIKLSLPMRCVRFGTFKMNCQRPLEITAEHINLVVTQDRQDEPSRGQSAKQSSISFVIAFKHIRRIEFSFTNTNSVMYLMVNDYCGRKIRESLGIDTEMEAACADETLSYFNPDSPHLYHQFITIMTDVETYAAKATNDLTAFFKQFVEMRRRELKMADLRKQYGDETLIPAHVLHIEPLLHKMNNVDARKRFTDVFPPYLTQQISGGRRNVRPGLQKPRAAAGGVYPTDNLARPPINARYAADHHVGPSTSYRSRVIAQQQQHPQTQVITNGQVIVHAAKGSHVIVCQSPQAGGSNGQQIVGRLVPASAAPKNLTRHYQTVYGYTTPQGLVTTKVITIRKQPVKRVAPPTISQTIMLEDEADGDEPSTSKCARVETLLAYPESERDAVTVHVSDMECLDDEQFLNDTIIDFFLKYTLRQSPPDLQSRVYIFNTFFWRRLTLRPRSTAFVPEASTAAVNKQQIATAAKYNSVKSWTKDVDIFDKDFIIVPINEDAHWYLAIICYPMSAVKCESNAEMQTPPTDSSAETSSPCASRPAPCIVLLDSLRDAVPNRYKTVGILKEYLMCEWADKGKGKATGGVLDRQLIKGSTPKNVPQQDNYWDCGVFVLEYVEQFLKQPPEDILQGNKNDYLSWFPNFSVANKRSAVRLLIKSMCTEEKWALVPPPIEVKVENEEEAKGNKRFEVVDKPREVLQEEGRQSVPPSHLVRDQNRRCQSSPPSINR